MAVSVLSQLVSTSNSPTELYKLILYCVLTKLLRFVVSVKFTFFFPPSFIPMTLFMVGVRRGEGLWAGVHQQGRSSSLGSK